MCKPVRVLMCGSRTWTDRDKIQDVLDGLVKLYAPNYPTIVHGFARGADRLVEDEAGKAGLVTEVHKADWEKLGKLAGFARNEEMAQLGAMECVAFWDGKSNGTRDMMERAEKHGIPVRVIS